MILLRSVVSRFFVFLFLLFLLTGFSHAQNSDFYTEAPHAIIMDATTGEVLFEKDARVPMSPASMTKIMTAHMVFDALKNEFSPALNKEFSSEDNVLDFDGTKTLLEEHNLLPGMEVVKESGEILI